MLLFVTECFWGSLRLGPGGGTCFQCSAAQLLHGCFVPRPSLHSLRELVSVRLEASVHRKVSEPQTPRGWSQTARRLRELSQAVRLEHLKFWEATLVAQVLEGG